jgi:hypothetical protein
VVEIVLFDPVDRFQVHRGIQEVLSKMQTQSKLMAGLRMASLVVATTFVGSTAQASTIGFTYNFTNFTDTKPPTVVGTTLLLSGMATGGSLLTGDPALDAAWNPVVFEDDCKVDLTTGLLNGTFFMTFANNDTLFGKVFEDVTEVIATFTGPYTGTLTFIGGTGEFAGATGSASIGGTIGLVSSTASGSGTLSGPAVVPEPGTLGLMATGLLAAAGTIRRSVLQR